MLGKVTQMDLADLFTVKKFEVLPYEMPNNNWMSVSFEMDLNMILVER